QLVLAAALDATDDSGPQGQPRLRTRLLHRPGGFKPERAVVRAGVRRRHRAVCEQPFPVRPTRRARPARVAWPRAARAARRRAVPVHRGAALPADPGRARVLLVPAARPGRRGAVMAAPAELEGMLEAWLPRQRWFAGKGRPFSVVALFAGGILTERPWRSDVWLVRVRYTDDGSTDTYQ